MTDLKIRCRCGEVRGEVTGASPRTTNRIVCYCDDCQAYAHHLGRSDLLDAHGGSDIVQVAPAALRFHQGEARIVGLRLTPKGLFRWYADCCKQPLGNTLKPGIPFVGIVVQGFDCGPAGPDAVLGPPRGAILGKFAVGSPPEGSTRLQPRMLLHVMRLMLGWKLGGRAHPHPFFDREGRATHALTVLGKDEREALRSLCGPTAVAAS